MIRQLRTPLANPTPELPSGCGAGPQRSLPRGVRLGWWVTLEEARGCRGGRAIPSRFLRGKAAHSNLCSRVFAAESKRLRVLRSRAHES